MSASELDSSISRREQTSASAVLAALVGRHKAGEPVGMTSICSANPFVLEAGILQAQTTGGHVLIEATSNQVDQDGGYTGMRPADFRDLVHGIARRHGLPRERVVLGGDHLGPNRWRALPAVEAMRRAEMLVGAYVAAGYTKIHLDCTFTCAGDPRPLTDEIVSARTSQLVVVAEATAAATGGESRLRYVIGTEVPTPGGAEASIAGLQPTTPGAAARTIACHRQAFTARGLGDVWPRVMALVVQPGVEFDHMHIVDYLPGRTVELRRVLDNEPHMVFEAHSTDYQMPASLRALVKNHWAVLKVGPALTFALREALFALAAMEDEIAPPAARSRLPEILEATMVADPIHWQDYYTGDSREQHLARRYSYSDRLRYYWPDPAVQEAQGRLFDNLDAAGIPLPLLSQYLPNQYLRVRKGALAPEPRDLVIDHVRDVLRTYARATSAPASWAHGS